jgi:hypothetical protein
MNTMPSAKQIQTELDTLKSTAIQQKNNHPRPGFVDGKQIFEARLKATPTPSQSTLNQTFRQQTMLQLHPGLSMKELSPKQSMDVVSTAALNKKLILELAQKNRLNDSLLNKLLSNVKLAVQMYEKLVAQSLEKNSQLREQQQTAAQDNALDPNSPTSIMFALQLPGTDAANQYDMLQGLLLDNENVLDNELNIEANKALSKQHADDEEIADDADEAPFESQEEASQLPTPQPEPKASDDKAEEEAEHPQNNQSEKSDDDDLVDISKSTLDKTEDLIKCGHLAKAGEAIAASLKALEKNTPTPQP